VYCRTHPADPRFRPFCSERCRLLDLGSWMDGRYRVEANSPVSDDDLETDSIEDGDA
jgi:endogenous inhibitor of DNA gyrase (YacG/DUF329 family)